jgi:uncharacterized pyridoxal phosphate-containing UPF0001 family protein
MATLAVNLGQVRDEVARACAASGRPADAVRLIAVTKTQEPGILAELGRLGVGDIGENRLDHLELMQGAAPAGMRVHAIGRLQGRQIPAIVRRCHALHSLCEPDHLERLAHAVAAAERRLEIFLQVNTSGEASKAGVAPAGLPALLARCRVLGLAIVGLMTMAPESACAAEDAQVRDCFRACAMLAREHGLPRLSMGMSQDFTVAVEEGATDIRVGTRLFA